MSVTPTFVGSGTDYAESPPWYKNHTVWLVGGGLLAIVVFYFLYSQNSATGTTASVASPGTGSGTQGTTSANLLAAMQKMNTNDQQILSAIKSGQTSTGTTSSSTTGSSTSTSTSGGGTGSSTSTSTSGGGTGSSTGGSGSGTVIGGPGTQFQESPPPNSGGTWTMPSSIDYLGTTTSITSLPKSNQTALSNAYKAAVSSGYQTTLINGIPQSYYQGVSTPKSGYYTGEGFGGSGTPVFHKGMRPGGS
jgi:hypothetical protein